MSGVRIGRGTSKPSIRSARLIPPRCRAIYDEAWGGVNRRVLERIKDSGGIFFAEADRPWILNGAAVRVSMVGFDDGSEQERTVDGLPVAEIAPALTGEIDLSTANRLRKNLGVCFMGPSAKAPFDIDADVAAPMLAAPSNVQTDS